MAGWVDREPIEEHGLTINPCFLRPKSRGSVKITSADPKQPALFDTRSLAEQEDVDVLVRGVKKAIEIFRAPAMQEVMGEFALPTPDKCDDDVAIEDFVRQTAKTVYHPVGTAKMGPDSDPMAVVDSQLKVKGVEGLRVADVSIMPTLVSGNTNAPAMMIAEKASRFILGR
jgi:choline dehydrogenase-like flavoprotein